MTATPSSPIMPRTTPSTRLSHAAVLLWEFVPDGLWGVDTAGQAGAFEGIASMGWHAMRVISIQGGGLLWREHGCFVCVDSDLILDI